MILLPPNHPLIESIFAKELQADPSQQYSPIDMTFDDFDRTTWSIQSTEASYTVSITLSDVCRKELLSSSMTMEHISRLYPSPLYTVQASAVGKGPSITLKWSKDSMAKIDIKQVSLLKRNLLAVPIFQALTYFDQWSPDPKLNAKEKSPLFKLEYREQEAFHVQAFADHLVIVFSATFQDQTDALIGKLFLQEFVDARRGSSMQDTPQVIYSKDPPSEIASDPLFSPQKGASSAGYISFILFPRHLQPGKRRDTAIDMLVGFRSYYHYHIKCSKAYLHSKLRAKMAESLKVLNRAYPTKPATKTV